MAWIQGWVQVLLLSGYPSRTCTEGGPLRLSRHDDEELQMQLLLLQMLRRLLRRQLMLLLRLPLLLLPLLLPRDAPPLEQFHEELHPTGDGIRLRCDGPGQPCVNTWPWPWLVLRRRAFHRNVIRLSVFITRTLVNELGCSEALTSTAPLHTQTWARLLV